MKNMILLLILVMIFGCAHRDKNETPIFSYSPELLEKIFQSGPTRFPASSEIRKSNRRVYFSGLYYQYKTLGHFLNETQENLFCPQFHHDRLQVDSWRIPKIRFEMNETQESFYFPENIFKSKKELKTYVSQMKEEIHELCETGESDNFFKYDNLIVYHVSRPEFHQNHKSMEALLKIPIFSNHYLISMMRNSLEIEYFPNEAKLFIDQAKTYWFDRYVNLAQKGRQDLLVRRF
jgi:hypothetical protein